MCCVSLSSTAQRFKSATRKGNCQSQYVRALQARARKNTSVRALYSSPMTKDLNRCCYGTTPSTSGHRTELNRGLLAQFKEKPLIKLRERRTPRVSMIAHKATCSSQWIHVQASFNCRLCLPKILTELLAMLLPLECDPWPTYMHNDDVHTDLTHGSTCVPEALSIMAGGS